jgi:type I restriction enzyme, S subunit
MSTWSEEILSKKIDLIHGHQFRDNDFVEDGFPVIKIGQLNQNGEIDLSNCSFVDRNNLEIFRDYRIYKGDILMALTGATLGKTVRVSIDLGVIFQNYRVGKFQPVDDTISKEFLYFLLTSDEIQREMLLKINSAAQGNIGKSDFEKIKIKYPSLPEQQRIAKILSTCDAVIEKTQTAIAKYKAIKQGMLHDLFTRGIDITTGKLRPRFEDAPELYKESKLGMIPKEWEEKQLDEICSMKSGEGITAQSIFELGDYRVYGGNGLRGYTSSFTHDGEFTLIGRQGALCGNITRVSGKFYASEHAVVVTVQNEIAVDWLSQKLNTMNLNQYSEASAQPGLSVNKILRLSISVPPYDEQKKMAERLNTIDAKLQIEQTYLQKLQQIKKGLMEDLLSGKKMVKLAEQNQKAAAAT